MPSPLILRLGTAPINGAPVFVIVGTHPRLCDVFGAFHDMEKHRWLFPAFHPAAADVLDDLRVLKIPLTPSPEAAKYIERLPRIAQAAREGRLPASATYVTDPYTHQRQGTAHLLYNHRAGIIYDPGLGKSKVFIDFLRVLRMGGGNEKALVVGPLITVSNFGAEIEKHGGGALRWAAVLGNAKERAAIVEKAAADDVDILICTYGYVVRNGDFIGRKFPYGVICADEGHRLADPRTEVCWAMCKAAHRAARRILMTGTATLGDPLRIYGQLRFLGDCFAPETYSQFKNKHVEYAEHNDKLIVGYKGIDVLQQRYCQVALRKTREECLDLPPRQFVPVYFDLSDEQRRTQESFTGGFEVDLRIIDGAIEAISRGGDAHAQRSYETDGPDVTSPPVGQAGGASIYDVKGGDAHALADGPTDASGQHVVPPPVSQAGGAEPIAYMAPNAAVMTGKLSQVRSGFLLTSTNDPEACTSCPHLAGCVAAEIRPYTSKCVVLPRSLPPKLHIFSKNPMLEALKNLVEDLTSNPTAKVLMWCRYKVELDLAEELLKELGLGYTRMRSALASQGSALAKAFCEDPTQRVWLSQLAMGIGLTLTAASYSVYVNLPYPLEHWEQSNDRNYRIGTVGKVTVFILLGRGTLDDQILEMLKSKKSVDRALTDPNGTPSPTVKRVRLDWRTLNNDDQT